jgi:putative solute-binding protein
MKILHIGCVDYINALPFHLPFTLHHMTREIQFTLAIPSQLNVLLRTQQLDAALTSSVEYLDGDDTLPTSFGISGEKRILSVNLYSQFPLSQLSGERIGVTHESATSVALLKVLCHYLWKIQPSFELLNPEEPYSNYAAVLRIGDHALKYPSLPGFQTIDLATAWYELTALPFVFALLMIKKEREADLILLEQQLEAALLWSHTHIEEVEKEALKRCSLPLEQIRHYYSLLNYHLKGEEWESLKIFKQLKQTLV